MKTLYNAVLALLVTTLIFAVNAQDDASAILHDALTALEADTQLYSQLQFELDEISKQFDESAEMRRRLQCCVAYKVDSLNEKYTRRENELLAIIADKDQRISDLEERVTILEAETAAELDALSNVIEVLALQLQECRDFDALEDDSFNQEDEDVSDLIAQVQEKYAAMEKQRLDFLAKLEDVAEKAYGYFEVEAIENTVFGEQICGTLYCPELEDQSVQDAVEASMSNALVLE